MSKKIRSFALPIIGGLVAGPLGAGAGAAANSLTSGGNLGQALKAGALSGVGSYVGGQIGGSIGGGGGTVASTLEKTLGPDLGSAFGNVIGSGAYLSPVNAIIGSGIGSNLASSLVPQKTASSSGTNVSTAFKASREKESAIPASFSSYGGSLTPTQLSSNIATGGVYGGGAGPEESDYFLNMINRRLVDDSGKVDSDLSEINPIENSFLSQIGLGGMNNANDLLEAISKRRAA
jgi:hypothetical protein